MTATPVSVDLSTIVSLCKRRGFLFQSSEIYGGLASTWDYGPLGVELKRSVKDAWWRHFVWGRDDMVGLDASVLMHPDVWRASGHVANFSDPLVECKNCHRRWKEDELDFSTFRLPGFVEIRFRELPGLRETPRSRQFSLEYVEIKGFTKPAGDGKPLIKSVSLVFDGLDPIPAVPASRYISDEPSSWEPAPREIDGTGSLVTNGRDMYTAGFPPISIQQANRARSIRVEVTTPQWSDVPINLNLETGSLTATRCPDCGGELTEPRMFNLMFKTHLGPVEDDASTTYLRPETAQGIFVNFENVLTTTRRKPPFGIAQIGKAFRNEITTGSFIFRTREFEIMELEYFVIAAEAERSHKEWTEESMGWYTGLGLREDRLRLRAHDPDELAHYSAGTSDVEYMFPWGWGEIGGIANRTDFDLRAHSEASGESLSYFDEESKEHITPYVIEPTFGVDRSVLAFLVDAYVEEEVPDAKGKLERRVLLKLHPTLAPVKVAVLPLSRNERLVPLAREVHDRVRRSGAIQGLVQYDDAQSIGRRYRRQDETGTPLCVTVDFDSLEDRAVTIRDRDSMAQQRVPIEKLVDALKQRLEASGYG